MFRLYLQDIDHRIFRFFNHLAGMSPISDRFFVFSAEFIVFAMIAALALFVLLKRERLRQTAVLQAFTAGFFSRVVFDSLIYIFFFRPRPFISATVYQLVYHNPMEPSFPSGHASIMFAIAFSIFFADKKWGAVYLFLALISSLSRIVVGIHYPLDIAGGFVVGAVSAYSAKLLFDVWFLEKQKPAK